MVIFVSGSPEEVLQRCVVSLTFLSPKPPLAEDPSPLQPCQAVETVRELGGPED